MINKVKNIHLCTAATTPDWCYQSNSKRRIARQYEIRFIKSLTRYQEVISSFSGRYDDITLAISYATSAINAFNNIIRSYDSDILKNFIFSNENDMNMANKYFDAISLYLSNPIITRRRDLFGVGEYISTDCLPISSLSDDFQIRYINLHGLSKKKVQRKNYHAYFITKFKNEKLIGDVQLVFSMDDISYVLQLYVNKYIEINSYLNNFSV